MTGVFETEDGTQYHSDNLERKEKCDFCGKLGGVPDDDEFIDGKLPSLHNEDHDYTDICRECLVKGISKEKLEEELGSREEIIKEKQERQVELS